MGSTHPRNTHTDLLTVTPDGDRIDPNVPVVTVTGTFAECVLLETVVLSILNSDATIATRAAAGPDATLYRAGNATLVVPPLTRPTTSE